LLNRFDDILESFCKTYSLNEGPQMREFRCDVLLNKIGSVTYGDDQPWTVDRLKKLGYTAEGDCQLVVAVLKFTRMLLEHCGNRSIYGSSAHLSDLLNTTYLEVVHATLEVGLELAQRYQASVKRMTSPSRQMSTALLANHYNIELDKVHLLALPFVKTPIVKFADIVPTTPASASKGAKEKSHKNVASMYANDLVAIATADHVDEGRWNGWGDIKVTYFPKASGSDPVLHDVQDRTTAGYSSVPATPTPLRRSATVSSSHQTPRANRPPGADGSPSPRTPAAHDEPQTATSHKTLEIPQSVLVSTSIYDLLSRCPADMPDTAKYEFLNRLRISKALLASPESRQRALAVRLLAVSNLAYIHVEQVFMEKALKQDNDEPRRYQLVYQLAELIHPSADGTNDMPIWLQSIALVLLEAISNFTAKYSDVLSALNANVNHGVLLYVIRKAVAGMKDDPPGEDDDKVTGADEWRNALFSLTLHMAMGSRVGQEMITAGLMDILVEILNLRSKTASRNHSMVLAFLDGLIYGYQGAFQSFSNASGLASIANLIVHTVSEATALAKSGHGTRPELHSHVVDYEIPFYHQQTLKWLLKFIHHVMSNSFSYGGNTDRLLRNLVDNSQLLGSLRSTIENKKVFGSVVWTNGVTLLSDFINNDPTSFAAISESGMIKTFLETLTGRTVVAEQPTESQPTAERSDDEDDDPSSPADSEESVVLETDSRPHPPTQETLEEPRDGLLASGILPSSEAMGIIPIVLNSISLNNAGMKMVVASRALESYLEIFESPDHVRCMDSDPDLPTAIGNCFDELARHHPALRPAISNAVIDMTARIAFLSRQKAETDGWGAKLLVTDPDGKPISADESLLSRSVISEASSKGKGKAVAGDLDVEMTDADHLPAVTPSGVVSITEPTAATATPYNGITPYIRAVSSFLSHVVGNSNLKSSFVDHGGIELLLDLAEAPSLPHDFSDSVAARTLYQVVSQLLETSPVLGVPSLLNRLQDAIDGLEPLLKREGSHPFFAPFLLPDLSLTNGSGEWDQGVVKKVAGGTRVTKSLLNAQTLIKMLYQCFPYSSRQGGVFLPLVNAFDYYVRLIKSLGPLLRLILSEETSITYLVPQHWSSRGQSGSHSPSEDAATANPPLNGIVTNADGENAAVQDVLTGAMAQQAGDDANTLAKRPSGEELSSPQYLNYQILRVLLHSLMPTTFPLFQTIGKSLLGRRERDSYIRSHHMAIAEALAETILEQLKPSEKETTMKDLHYWIVMLHTVHEMLVDPSRHGDRPGVQIILPVLLAFKELGGLDALNNMLEQFADDVCKHPADGDEESKGKLAAIGMKKILDLYVLIVHGKNISDSVGHINLSQRSSDRRASDAPIAPQLVVELRMAILPVVTKLWESPLVEKCSTQVLGKVIDILKTIATADMEANAYRRSDRNPPPTPIFTREPVKFNWSTNKDLTKSLSRTFDPDLAQEAVYRANGKNDDATEYCKAHQQNRGGRRNPIPEEDAYQNVPSPKPSTSNSTTQTPSFPLPEIRIATEPMSLDSVPELDRLLGDAIGEPVLGDGEDQSSESSGDEGQDSASQQSAEAEAVPEPIPVVPEPAEAASSTGASASSEPARAPVAKDELDQKRAEMRKDLIDRCLDVILAHPDSVFEVSELIHATILAHQESEEKRTEVGEVLANALVSFAIDDEVKKSSARSIAAYAHLLSLLLQDKPFYKLTVETLKGHIGDYLGFLQLPPASSNEDLPPYIPYILLIFEILLSDDQQPVEVKWKAPTSEDEAIEEPVLQEREPNLQPEERATLFNAIIDVLPRIGKEESLAISVLRTLVILTRDRTIAKSMGEKYNLQRLFLMVKQLCGSESGRLRDSRISKSVLIVLRHIIEDEDTIRQIMQAEIRTYMDSSQRGSRSHDILNYLRHLSHIALRAPKIFVDVTAEMVKLTRWTPSSADAPPRQVTLALKDAPPPRIPTPPVDSSVEPTVQATEDLTISDVKPSTEADDKEMGDDSKTPAQDSKRPVLENPDGVVQFLLNELLTYKEVVEKEPLQLTLRDDKPRADLAGSSASPSISGESAQAEQGDEGKDKKSLKPVFKPEEHPVFVYRCFILHCLAELLQSYNRAKVEFINFKRNAPILSNTPVKPRASVLNYLLNDLLCLSSLSANMDSIAIKKKAATSSQAQLVLVALVAKTGEKSLDRLRDGFEYDDEPELLFVRRFVLDTILKSYKEASQPIEPFDLRYAKMLCLAELMSQMIGEKEKDPPNPRGTDPAIIRSQMQLKRLMYEKGYLAALTASIAEIDLTFPNVKRTIKYILRVLRTLTKTAIQLSQSDIIASTSADNIEDDIASATSSVDDLDDEREDTPNLYRNSALGMLESVPPEDFSDNSEDGKKPLCLLFHLDLSVLT
jgi:E3 ubiquitin-protein ligase HUWE1